MRGQLAAPSQHIHRRRAKPPAAPPVLPFNTARHMSAPGGRAQRGAERAAIDQRQQQRVALAAALAALCGRQLRQQELRLLRHLSISRRRVHADSGRRCRPHGCRWLRPAAPRLDPARVPAASLPPAGAHLGGAGAPLGRHPPQAGAAQRHKARGIELRACGGTWVQAAGESRQQLGADGWAPALTAGAAHITCSLSIERPTPSTHLAQREVEARGVPARLSTHHRRAVHQPHARLGRQARQQRRAGAGHQVAAPVKHVHQGARGGWCAHGGLAGGASASWQAGAAVAAGPCVGRAAHVMRSFVLYVHRTWARCGSLERERQRVAARASPDARRDSANASNKSGHCCRPDQAADPPGPLEQARSDQALRDPAAAPGAREWCAQWLGAWRGAHSNCASAPLPAV